MSVIVALLSAVNVGKRKAPAAELRRLCADLGWKRAETLLASGNIIVDIGRLAPAAAAAKLEAAIRAGFGFECAVIVRNADELDAVRACDPFPAAPPNQMLVHFMRAAPDRAALDALARFAKEKAVEPHLVLGRELFIRFDTGVAGSKLTAQALKRVLGTPGTARNRSTVEKLLARARAMEAA